MRNLRGLTLLAILVLLLGILPQSALAEQTQIDPESPVYAYPFNINPSPKNMTGVFPVETGRAPFIVFRNLPLEAVVRVYDSSRNNANLLGVAEGNLMSSATVGINQGYNQNIGTGYVYYTVQEPGKTESARQIVYMGQSLSPRVEVTYQYIEDDGEVSRYDRPIEQSSSYTAMNARLDTIYPGDVVVANVCLRDVPYMTGITMPLRYDTETLELLAKRPAEYTLDENGNMIPEPNTPWNYLSEKAFTAEGNEYIPEYSTSLGEKSAKLGMVVGNAMYYELNMPRSPEELANIWMGEVRHTVTETGSSDRPYINMETGYITFGANVEETSSIPAGYGSKDKTQVSSFSLEKANQTLLRLYFRYKGTKAIRASAFLTSSTLKYGDQVVETGLAPVRVATQKECPPEYLGTSLADKFYNTSYPEGVVPQIGLVNIFAPNPPALLNVDNDYTNSDYVAPQEGTVSVGEVLNEYANETLPIDHVKVYNFTNEGYDVAVAAESTTTLADLAIGDLSTYNYTNSPNVGSGPYQPLDKIRDYMKIQFTTDLPIGGQTTTKATSSGTKVGDIVKIYGDKTSLTPLVSQEIAPPEPRDMEIDLGTDILSAQGGKLYLAVERGDLPGSESERVEIVYDKEYQRDVYFEVSRENFNGEKISQKDNPSGYENAMEVPPTEGEKWQIKVYFNDFRDLRGYMLPLSFNAKSVKVADGNFNAVADGGVTMQQILTGSRGIRIGKDSADCSVGEAEIWSAVSGILAANEGNTVEINKQLDTLFETCNWKNDYPLEVKSAQDLMRIYEEVEAKLALGVADVEKSWYGGLFFGNAETDSEFASEQVPYIINHPYPGDNGFVDIWAMSYTAGRPLLDRYVTETVDGVETEVFKPYHVLTINFVGQKPTMYEDMNPNFHMASNSGGSGDANYSICSPNGFAPAIMGDKIDTVTVTPGHNEHWSIQKYEEEYDYQIVLNNRPEADSTGSIEVNGEKSDLYTYFKQPFRDPGYTIESLVSGVPEVDMATAEVVRELVIDTTLKDGTKLQLEAIPLDAYSQNEVNTALTDALVSAGVNGTNLSKLEASVKYSYLPDNAISHEEPIQATRKVFVIHQRGDINRDGSIDNNDYVALMNHVTRKKPIVEFDNFLDSQGNQTNKYYDAEYVLNVGDIDNDGFVYSSDAARLKLHTQYGLKIVQKYQIPEAVTPGA